MFPLAQFGGYSIAQMAIIVVIIISLCGIVYVVAKANNVTIPSWAITIFWILVVAVVAIFAIKFIAGMV